MRPKQPLRKRRRKIRVGLIRCDTHGMYYGPLMQAHDPLLLRQPKPVRDPFTYSWQQGGAWYYLYTHYARPTYMTAEPVEGFEITRLWDRNRAAAEMAAKVFLGKPVVCKTFEECSDDVDLVFICDCNLEGQDHLKLAAPGLKKGVATFVDKPFAHTLKDAFEMFRLADLHRAPIWSTSMLRMSRALDAFKRRLPETGGPNLGSITGFGTRLDGLIHAITAAQTVFGPGVQAVRAMKTPRQTAVYLDYGDRSDRPRHGVLIACDTGGTSHGALYVTALGPRSLIVSESIGDWDHPASAANVLRATRRWLKTGELPVSRTDTIETIAIAEAIRRSGKTGKTVNLAKLLRPFRRDVSQWTKRSSGV
jgi:predicted dehydrogenase